MIILVIFVALLGIPISHSSSVQGSGSYQRSFEDTEDTVTNTRKVTVLQFRSVGPYLTFNQTVAT